jgi:hypothetical protein
MAAALAGCSGGGGGGKKVLLEAAASTGPDAFTTSVSSTPAPSSTVPATVPPVTAAPGATRHISGSTPGLYGGTQNSASCDVEQMVSFLTSHADKGRAWAQTEGITLDQLPDYLRSLTPVLLRVDTRVTNHGFAGGKPTPRQSVLQAGTAVLVDKTGVPRAKCACGNPLLPPVASTGATFSGAAWSGFKPADVVIVNQTTTVNQFILVDVNTGQQFSRPVGGTGSTDTPAQVGGTREQDRVFTGTATKSLGDLDMDVPFIVQKDGQDVGVRDADTLTLTGTGLSELQHAGHYPGLTVTGPTDRTWKVVIRPLGPNLHHQTGRGDTTIGTLSLPDQVVIEFKGPGTGGDFYLSSDSGVLASFTAEPGSQLAGLDVNDHKNAGWTLDIWGVPPGCGYDTGGENGVKCA